MGLIQDLMRVISGGGGGQNRAPQPWDEHIPGMERDPYGKPRLPGVDYDRGGNDPGMGNSTPVAQVRTPPFLPSSANIQPIPSASPQVVEPIQPGDVSGPAPTPMTGKLTDDMAASSRVDTPTASTGTPNRPSLGPGAEDHPANLTPEGLDKDLMEMSAGMPNLRSIYNDSQTQIEKERADVTKLENPTMKSMFMKFIPALATTALGAALGGKRGAMRGASVGMGYPVGVAARKKLQYTEKNDKIKTEEGRQDKAVESGIRAREVAARLSEARDYHANTVDVRRQHEGNIQTRNQQQDELNSRKAGLARDADGVLRPLPVDQLTPQQRAVLDNTQEGANLKRSVEDLDAARAELIRSQNDPNSPVYQLALRKVRAAEYAHQIAAANLGQKQLEWEYHMSGTQQGVPVPGQLTVDGQVVGDKPGQYNKLTSRQQDTVSQARSVEAVGKDLSTYIRTNKALFGPLEGRGNMMERIIGSTDPKFAAFQQKFDSFVALHPKLHDFRGLTAAKMFDKTYGGAIQNADALATAIDTGIGSAETIRKANIGNRGTVPGGKKKPLPADQFGGTLAPPGGKKRLAAPDGTRAQQGDGSWMVKRNGAWVKEAVQ